MLVSLLGILAGRFLESPAGVGGFGAGDYVIASVGLLYWAGSRDTLKRYYERAAVLLGTAEGTVYGDERTRDGDGGNEEECVQGKTAAGAAPQTSAGDEGSRQAGDGSR